MSGLLEKVRRLRDTHHQVRDTIRPLHINVHLRDTGERAPRIDRHKEWELSLVFVQNFWANDAQRDMVCDHAMRTLCAQLYGEVHALLPLLELSIQSGDGDGAMRVIGQIRKAMEP